MGTVGARHDWHSSKRVGHICLHQCEGVGTSFRILYLRILRSTCARGLFTGSFGQSAMGGHQERVVPSGQSVHSRQYQHNLFAETWPSGCMMEFALLQGHIRY